MKVVKVVTHHKNPAWAAELFYQEGVVAVGWTDFGDLKNLTKEQIMEISRKKWRRTPAESLKDATQLICFRDEIAKGDLIIAYRKRNTVAMIGEVESDYYFDDKNLVGNPRGEVGYANQRKVKWWKEPRNFNRSYLPSPLKEKVALPGTVSIISMDFDKNELVEHLKKAGLNVSFEEEPQRNWWVEKTYVKGRPGRESGDYALGKALWSPQKDKRGADYYKNMREVKKGDVVLHLIDNESIVGVSVVEQEYDDTFTCLPGTEWDDGTGKRPGYLIRLKDYVPLDQPIRKEEILNEKNKATLTSLLAGYKNLFYNRSLKLSQGAYITKAPQRLVELINNIYKEKTGKGLPYFTPRERESFKQEVSARGNITLNDYLVSRGFVFDEPLVSAFYVALKTKGFVILAGLTGTGKTKLPQLFCDLILDEKQHLFVPVRPDWRDSKPLIGYFNPIEGLYEDTKLLSLIESARDNWINAQAKVPFILLLDEMNLARVEYYFADFLSVLESGRDENTGFLTKEPILLHSLEKNCQTRNGESIPSEIKLPPNLYFVGTVNIDETTYSFSPKVLDRAFVVEFWQVDLEKFQRKRSGEINGVAKQQLKSLIIEDLSRNGKFLAYTEEDVDSAIQSLGTLFKDLKGLHEILQKFGLHFGYRVIKEIALFYKNAVESMNKRIIRFDSNEQILDYAILMKILPKIHGNRGKVEASLIRMLAWAMNPEKWNEKIEEIQENGRIKSELLQTLLNSPMDFLSKVADSRNIKYRHTAEKVTRMLYQVYSTGFTSYL